MEARVTLTGRVGGPIEVHGPPDGVRIATFRLGCTPRRRDRDGEWSDQPTTWITVKLFGWLGHNAGRSLSKGEPVLVHGRLRTEQWTGREGELRERLTLHADSIGHDLNYGQAAYRKRPGSARPEQDDDSTNLDTDTIRLADGESVDRVTGEIVGTTYDEADHSAADAGSVADTERTAA